MALARPHRLLSSLLAPALLWACGGAAEPGAAAQRTVQVQPDSVQVAPLGSFQFASLVSGTIDTGVAWAVVEPSGGTISASGLYGAPQSTGTFHVRASSRADPSVQGSATVTVTTTPPPSGVPSVGGCPVFTADDAWNSDISTAPVSAAWTTAVHNLVGSINLHPDFGGGSLYGIPFNVVPQGQAALPVSFDYADESDPGPYPFPPAGTVKIEGNDPTCADDGDCHVLAVQQGVCRLYEGWACRTSGSGWHCGSGAVFDLTRKSQGQRQSGWTSADAAGLPVLAGLIRYAEVAVDREVKHAIRFTVRCTRAQFVAPASHYAVPGGCNPSDPNAPPMGLRMRLAASFDASGFGADAQVILRAMKRYGLVLADNGSDFYFQAEADARWTDGLIAELKRVPASAFEAVTP